MSSLLKDIYSASFYDNFSAIAGKVIPSFNKESFINSIFDGNWHNKELKDRMKHTSFVLRRFLPDDFEMAARMIEKIIIKLQQHKFTGTSIEFMFFPDYIETYGIGHFDTSVRSIEFVTQFTSCEFAVRPFIIRYKDKMLQQMLKWSLHENHKVRRLASEGTRPRLPWAIGIPELKKNPAPILPLLDNLRNDPSEWVRKSVANNLNDISKDHPAIVMSVARRWKGIGKETDAIIKHGCRTLLKQGYPDVLKYYGLNESKKISVSGLKILAPKFRIGKDLNFSFRLKNTGTKKQTVRIEYAIYYVRQNGRHSKKVFKISERQFQPGEQADVLRKHSFKIITTRKFYPGEHTLSIIINGQERLTGAFRLLK